MFCYAYRPEILKEILKEIPMKNLLLDLWSFFGTGGKKSMTRAVCNYG